jgi:hypothetical protein
MRRCSILIFTALALGWVAGLMGSIEPLPEPASARIFTSFAALQAERIGAIDPRGVAFVLGYEVAGDGGGGTFYYDAASQVPEDAGTVFAPLAGPGRWLRITGESVSPEMFGAKGNSVTDDYDAFLHLAAYVNGGGCNRIMLAPRKTYYWGRYVDGVRSGVTDIEFRNVDGLNLDGAGSTILVKGGFNRSVREIRTLQGLVLTRCRNVVIRNLILDGNSRTVTKTDRVDEPNSHGVLLRSCFNVTLENVVAQYWTGDGYYIGNASAQKGSPLMASRQVTMINCVADHNGRQGLSIIQLRGGVFTNCRFEYTGKSSYGSHAPSAGIDIEPDYSTSSAPPYQMDINTGELSFTRCRFVGNRGMTLEGGGKEVDNVTCTGCYFDSAGAQKYAFQIAGVNFVVRDSYFNCDQAAIYDLLSPPISGGSLLFEHNEVHGAQTLFYSAGNSYPVTIRDCRFFMEETIPSNLYALYLTNPEVFYQHNYLFIDGKGYTPGTGGYQVKTLINGQSFDNRYETNLLASAYKGNTAHYALGIYNLAAILRNEGFKGTSPGSADTFRPRYNGAWDSRRPFSTGGLERAPDASSVKSDFSSEHN